MPSIGGPMGGCPWDPTGVSPGDSRGPFGPMGPGPWADGPIGPLDLGPWAQCMGPYGPMGPGPMGPSAYNARVPTSILMFFIPNLVRNAISCENELQKIDFSLLRAYLGSVFDFKSI